MIWTGNQKKRMTIYKFYSIFTLHCNISCSIVREIKGHTLLSASNSFFCSSEAIYESVNVATTTTPISSALRNGAILSSARSSQRIWRFSEALAQLWRMLMAEQMRSFLFCSMKNEKLINLFLYLF